MALRAFTDRNGVPWSVWMVQPTTGNESVLSERYRVGWLCFERVDAESGDRFRLPSADVPRNWEKLPDERLELLCRVAQLAPNTPASTEPSVDTGRTSIENEVKARVSGAVDGRERN